MLSPWASGRGEIPLPSQCHGQDRSTHVSLTVTAGDLQDVGANHSRRHDHPAPQRQRRGEPCGRSRRGGSGSAGWKSERPPRGGERLRDPSRQGRGAGTGKQGDVPEGPAGENVE